METDWSRCFGDRCLFKEVILEKRTINDLVTGRYVFSNPTHEHNFLIILRVHACGKRKNVGKYGL